MPEATFAYFNRTPRTIERALAERKTPLAVDCDAKAGRLRALATEAANNAAVAAARGDEKTAHMYHDDAEALSYGAAAIERQVRRHG